jgi:hypothetical protein
MAVQPIFSGGQLPVHTVSAQQSARDISPMQILQTVQVRSLQREADESADRANTVLADVGQTATYDVYARVDALPGDGRRRGSRFDRSA